MVSIILVRPSHPGNIGSVARAMKNMGFEKLILVKPKLYPSAEATAYASNAADILVNALVVENLSDALLNYQLVFGSTARLRKMSYPIISPKSLAKKVSESTNQKMAILFGSEQNGLSNEEIKHCHYLIHIPSNPNYLSLNLAQAVQIICYEIRQNVNNPSYLPESHVELATIEQIELFYAHFETLLKRIGFYTPQSPQKLMTKVRRLFNRTLLEKGEIRMLRGMLRYFEKYLK